VRGKVFAHDNGDHRHDASVRAEHGAAERGQHQKLVPAAVQAVRSGRVADAAADARRQQQRPPAKPFDDRGGKQVAGQRHQAQHDGASVWRDRHRVLRLRVGVLKRRGRVRFQGADADEYLDDAHDQHDGQRSNGRFEQVVSRGLVRRQ